MAVKKKSNNFITTHDKSELESILRNTGNNYDCNIHVGRKIIYDMVYCIADILEQSLKNPYNNYHVMTDITENELDYTFTITYYNQTHGAYAVYCLESIPTKNLNVVILKEAKNLDDY